MKDAVGILPIVGEEARLKAKYAGSSVSEASNSGTSILVSLILFIEILMHWDLRFAFDSFETANTVLITY